MDTLSLLSINLHCLEEENLPLKQSVISDFILKHSIDVVFLQEVAQYHDHPIVDGNIKESNYGHRLQTILQYSGHKYFYYYEPIKFSFNKYDEGVGILSKYPITNIKSDYISNLKDYQNWKTRKYIKGELLLEDKTVELYSVHLGWDSETESYTDQINKLVSSFNKYEVIIGGDFNVLYQSDYYQYTVDKGLFDLFEADQSLAHHPTFKDTLDVHQESGRIDYIFSTMNYTVLNQKIVFQDPRVSDHYGIYMTILL
jgi:maltose 6'-phosphate phosphatase